MNTQVLEVRLSPGDEFIPAGSGGFVPRCIEVEKKRWSLVCGSRDVTAVVKDAQITGATWVSVI